MWTLLYCLIWRVKTEEMSMVPQTCYMYTLIGTNTNVLVNYSSVRSITARSEDGVSGGLGSALSVCGSSSAGGVSGGLGSALSVCGTEAGESRPDDAEEIDI